MTLIPRRILPPQDCAALLGLIQREFAYMEGRIDPPSSMLLLTEDAIARQAKDEEVWAIGSPPVACVFLTRKGDALYVGKLAVDRAHRGQGLAGQLLDLAEERAVALGLSALELQVRIELTENHHTFAALGFSETGRTAHVGYDRPTSITYRRRVRGAS